MVCRARSIQTLFRRVYIDSLNMIGMRRMSTVVVPFCKRVRRGTGNEANMLHDDARLGNDGTADRTRAVWTHSPPPRVPSLASLARRVSVGPWQRRRHTLDSWAPRWQASCSSRPRTFQHRRHAPSRTTRLHADVDVPTAARSDFKRPKKSSSIALTVYCRADKMFILALHENTQPLRTSVSSL